MTKFSPKDVSKVFKEVGIKVYPNNPSLYGLIFIDGDKNKNYSIFDRKDTNFEKRKQGIIIGLHNSDGISFFSKGEKQGYKIKNGRGWDSFKSADDFKDWCTKNVNRIKEYLNSLPDFSFKVGDKVRWVGMKEKGTIIRISADNERVWVKFDAGYKKELTPDELAKIEKTTASAESKVFAYKGQVITASSKQEAIQKIVASGNFVGVQKFTKAELKKAWDELVNNIEDDPENKKYPPDNGYDIRNGYSTGEDKDICGKDGHDWSISFDYEDVLKEISRITEVITYGDLEVYWNSNKHNMAEPDNHGIIIEDGKIKQVY